MNYKYTNENPNIDDNDNAMDIKRKNELFKIKNNLTNNIITVSII